MGKAAEEWGPREGRVARSLARANETGYAHVGRQSELEGGGVAVCERDGARNARSEIHTEIGKKREYCARARVDEIAEEEWCKKARKRQRAAYARRGAKEKKGERKNKGYIYTGSLYYGEEER